MARGHLAVGGTHTNTGIQSVSGRTGAEGVDSLFFEAPPAGTIVRTVTVDHGGLGYDLDVYFWSRRAAATDDASCTAGALTEPTPAPECFSFIANFTCVSDSPDETCMIPVGAAVVSVEAARGIDLSVKVLQGGVLPATLKRTYELATPGVFWEPVGKGANVGGILFPSSWRDPIRLDIVDRSDGNVSYVACQDSDGDFRCGASVGEPRLAGCGTSVNMSHSTTPWNRTLPFLVFLRSPVPDCGIASRGAVTLTYAPS
ncbi:MAG: hypothetical protein ACT4PT_01905 [Methanobacteriota archaeon]